MKTWTFFLSLFLVFSVTVAIPLISSGRGKSLQYGLEGKQYQPSAAAILRRFTKREVPVTSLKSEGGRKPKCFWPFITVYEPYPPPPPPPYGPELPPPFPIGPDYPPPPPPYYKSDQASSEAKSKTP